jgi:phage I-like protein
MGLIKFAMILKQVDGTVNEFQLLPFGEILIEDDDPVTLDEAGIAAIIDKFLRRGNDIVIDYEHQTMLNVQAPAAGWIKNLVNKGKDGLWVVVEWTARAVEYMKNHEYRYFSPVMKYEESSRRVISVENVALTNYPRINNLRPIIAKMSREEARAAQEDRSRKYKIGVKDGGHVTKPGEWEDVPDDEWLDPVNYRYPCPDAEQTRAAASYWGQKQNQAQYNPEERSIINERLDTFRKKYKIGEYRKEANKMEFLKKIIAKLKMKEDATEAQVIEEFDKIMTRNADLEKQVKDGTAIVAAKGVLAALKLPEDADEKTVVAKIESLSVSDTAALDLAKKVNELTETISAMKTEDLTTQALKNGQTSPDELKAWGNDLAKSDPEKFTKIVLSRAHGSVIPVEELGKKKETPSDTPDETQVSINKMMGIDEETWKKYGPKEAA